LKTKSVPQAGIKNDAKNMASANKGRKEITVAMVTEVLFHRKTDCYPGMCSMPVYPSTPPTGFSF
jgi:hypothetical protein